MLECRLITNISKEKEELNQRKLAASASLLSIVKWLFQQQQLLSKIVKKVFSENSIVSNL